MTDNTPGEPEEDGELSLLSTSSFTNQIRRWAETRQECFEKETSGL